MNYKPNEQELVAYLYDELEGAEKARVEQYLLANPDAQRQLEKLRGVSGLLGSIKDKEVIAPPIVLGDNKQKIWNTPYFRTTVSIAASLVIVMLVGRFSGANVSVHDNEFKLSFGEPRNTANNTSVAGSTLNPDEVQKMINESLQSNNQVLYTSWEESQQKLERSISKNIGVNSDKMNDIVRQASSASKEQIQQYVSTLQTDNMKLVKDYFTLTSGEQKQYIEGLLVDFAKYLQQQRNDDLQLVQMRLNNIEQNNTEFKQETEQILTSIISSVGTTPSSETKY
jgi:hypothetical protein